MRNYYQPRIVKIKNIKKQTNQVNLFDLHFKDRKGFVFKPGQFIELSIPGFGEAPFAICSSPEKKRSIQICVRKAGTLTSKLHNLQKNDELGIRGPYGNGFPIYKAKKRNLLLVVGGLGLIPLRPVIKYALKNLKDFQKIQLFYGACFDKDLLFKHEYKKWEKNIEFYISLDNPPKTKIKCHIGVVTTLFDKVKVPQDSVAFVCGPPIMYKFVLQKLEELNFKDEDIFLSLERRMHCGIGTCQHCAIGHKYVCKDGPIFSYAELKQIPNSI